MCWLYELYKETCDIKTDLLRLVSSLDMCFQTQDLFSREQGTEQQDGKLQYSGTCWLKPYPGSKLLRTIQLSIKLVRASVFKSPYSVIKEGLGGEIFHQVLNKAYSGFFEQKNTNVTSYGSPNMLRIELNKNAQNYF